MFKIGKAGISNENKYVIKYNPVRDTLLFGDSEIKGWKNSASSYSNMQLKVENDWKMCYLARTQGSERAFIEWSFQLENMAKSLEKIELKLSSVCYETGQIQLSLIWDGNQGETLSLDKNSKTKNSVLECSFSADNETYVLNPVSDLSSESCSFKIRADLSNGKGDCSWQHTQLFRIPLSNTNVFPFSVCFYFK